MAGICDLPGAGPKRVSALQALGICDLRQLAARFPVSYADLSRPLTAAQVRPGLCQAVRVTLQKPPSLHRKGAMSVLTARFADQTGSLRAIWFNQPYLMHQLTVGQTRLLYGYAQTREGATVLVNPRLVPKDEEGAILPVYPKTQGVPPRVYRSFVAGALEALASDPDPLPEDARDAEGLCPLDEARRQAHFPTDADALARARRRLAFDELLFYQLALRLSRGGQHRRGVVVPADWQTIQPLLCTFPYALTGAQERCAREILTDLSDEAPMARLLQGDVGSGKTAVAMLALYACAALGYQGALMAPTRVLAEQHAQEFERLLSPLGVGVGFVYGGMPTSARRHVAEGLRAGAIQIVIGTNALLNESLVFPKLALAVVDEQHRFGVRQRAALSRKGDSVNVLAMSATPIPRTLAIALYGDLEVSAIDELPPGRRPVKTWLIPERKRRDMLGFLQKEIDAGHQGYVICPLIDQNEDLDLLDAQHAYESLAAALPTARVGLLHGKMKEDEKVAALERFRTGALDVLVSTTVVEVGVNVPTATFMVVENALRFGLTQLHQLRGRVGRGKDQSYCFLMAENAEKLRVLTQTNDGFLIAKEDLAQRGPGEVLGTRQSGMLDAALAGAGDLALLSRAQQLAADILRQDDARWQGLLTLVRAQYEQRLSLLCAD